MHVTTASKEVLLCLSWTYIVEEYILHHLSCHNGNLRGSMCISTACYVYWISLPLFLWFLKLRAADGRPISNSIPTLGQANSIWCSHYWWLRTFPWISPFSKCWSSAPCDFNLHRCEKIPSTIIFWWEHIFIVQILRKIIWHISNKISV